MPRLTPVDGYIRVSRVGDRGDKLLSPELQRESIERVCQRDGLRVVNWYEELDASGGDNKRPLWNEAIARVESGKTRGIVCWNLSRFSRSVKDALNAIERIEDAGGRLYSEEGNLGKLDRGMRLLIAEDERDRATIGFRNARANAVNRGIYIAAVVPFGYRLKLAHYEATKERKLEVDPGTAPIVRALFEKRADGISWGRLSVWATEEFGRPFPKTSIESIVKNRAYLGHSYHGDLVNEKAHEPIVSRLLFDKANAIARARMKYVATGASKFLVLRGIVKCGNCGFTMRAGWRANKDKDGNRIPVYQCRNSLCESKAYVSFAEELDQYVADSVRGYLRFASAEQRDKASDPRELQEAEQELAELDHALTVFKSNRKAITTLGVDAWNELLEEYVTARDMAQTRVDALKEDNQDRYSLIEDAWNDWTPESKNQFLSQVIYELRVEPSRGRRGIPLRERVNLSVSFGGTEVEIHTSVTGFSSGPDYRDGEITFRPL